MTRIGVLALQGDVSEHILALQRAAPDLEVVAARRPGQIERCQALVIPGGDFNQPSDDSNISSV